MGNFNLHSQWTVISDSGPTYLISRLSINGGIYASGDNTSWNSVYQYEADNYNWSYFGDIEGGMNDSWSDKKTLRFH